MSDTFSTKEWRNIFDTSKDPVFLHDKEFRLILGNQAYFKLAGMTQEDALGCLYWEVFPLGEGALPSCLHALKEEEVKLPDGTVFLSRSTAVLDDKGDYRYSRHNLTDITAYKQAQRRIEHLNRLYRTLSLCNQALVHASDKFKLSQEICNILVDKGGYRSVCVLFGENIVSAVTVAWAGLSDADARLIATLARQKEDELEKRIITDKLPDIHNQLIHDNTVDKELVRMGINSWAAIPLSRNEAVFGALWVGSSEENTFDDETVALLSELAMDLSFGIANLRMQAERIEVLEKLEYSMDHAVAAIAATVEMRDPYTAGHQRRVALLAAAIATEMGLQPDRIEGLRIAGTVHDIGKIHVPAEILSNPDKLTDPEFSIIKTHPQAGWEILKGIDFPWPVAEIVLQHHEKLDGSGYPNGLRGDEILPEAKILCVADVVEAMASHRPYRPGFGIFPALQEISRNRGRLYDEKTVSACIRLFLEKGYEL